MGGENLAVDNTNHQPFFTPIKLKGFTQLKLERYIRGFGSGCGSVVAPSADEVSDDGMAAVEAFFLDCIEQHQRGTPVTLGTVCIGFQCQ